VQDDLWGEVLPTLDACRLRKKLVRQLNRKFDMKKGLHFNPVGIKGWQKGQIKETKHHRDARQPSKNRIR
jgi:hypothetical protein